MASKTGFYEGMQFFFVPRRMSSPEAVSVRKVGRKWVTLSNGYRFDRTSDMWRHVDGDGYSSPGKLWDTEQDYRRSLRIRGILRAIEEKFRFGNGAELLNLEDVEHAAALLGVDIGGIADAGGH